MGFREPPFREKGVKKWQTTSIAPLQPFILAVFLPWGGSTGAGRVRPAIANVRVELDIYCLKLSAIKDFIGFFYLYN